MHNAVSIEGNAIPLRCEGHTRLAQSLLCPILWPYTTKYVDALCCSTMGQQPGSNANHQHEPRPRLQQGKLAPCTHPQGPRREQARNSGKLHTTSTCRATHYWSDRTFFFFFFFFFLVLCFVSSDASSSDSSCGTASSSPDASSSQASFPPSL